MSETAKLADLIMRVTDGDPWHGSNVVTLLEPVSPGAAAAHPVPGNHSVWELVLHMTGWANEAAARLRGAAAAEPEGGDWPPVVDVTPRAWEQAKRALVDSHAALAAALRDTADAVLDEAVVDHRAGAAGTGQSRYVTVHGLVHHTTYHAGQIAVLVKAAAATR